MLEEVETTLGPLRSLSEDARRSRIRYRARDRNVENPPAIAQTGACARAKRAAAEAIVQADGVSAFAHDELFEHRRAGATGDVTPNRFHPSRLLA